MPRVIKLTIGTPPVSIGATTPVGVNFNIAYRIRKVVQRNFSPVFNIPTPTLGSSARFYGDPGRGNIYLGLSNPGGTAAYDARVTTFQHSYALARFFNGSGTINWATARYHAFHGRIPWPDVQGAAVIYADWAANNAAAQAYWDVMVTGINSCVNTLNQKVPVFISFTHECDANKIAAGTPANNFRLGKRNAYDYIKARCPNAVFTDCAITMGTFDATSGRDWRVWDVDWKGTTTAFNGSPGGPFNPNPIDFYQGVLSKKDMAAMDCYNFWGDGTANPGGAPTYNLWSDRSARFFQFYQQAYPVATRKPVACAEWGRVAYCGSYQHGGATGAEVFDAANFTKDQAWFDNAMAMMLANDVVAASYFDSSTAISQTGLSDPVDHGNTNSGGIPWGVYAYKRLLALATTKGPVF